MKKQDEEIIRDILRAFEQNRNFIIFNHTNPDGDALGSQLALHIVLNSLGKSTYLYSVEGVSPEYRFLPHAELIKTEFPSEGEFDVAVMLDCAKPERIGGGIEIDLTQYKEIINIDHHVSNTEFGTLNWVRPERSSAGELICELVEKMRHPVDADTATCLYTAIFTDTGGFRHSNTGVRTLRFASELVSAGARPELVARRIYASFPVRRLHLLGRSLDTLRTIEGGRAAYMWVHTEHLEQTGSTIADTDEFVEFPRSLGGVDIALLLKEITTNATARVNFRSNNPRCNVNRIASAFGGGGHAEASACNIEGTREEIERKVFEAVHNELAAAYAAADEEGNE